MRYKKGNSIARLYARSARRGSRGYPKAFIKKFGIRRIRRRR